MSSPSLRARLLLGARAALLRHGVDGVEVAEVAAAAGLPPGAFYRCFPSRDSLLEALVDQAVRAGGAAVERAVGAPADPAVAVAAFVRQAVRMTERDPLLACLASGARGVAEALTDDFSRRVQRSVSRGVWVGRFPVSSARVQVCAIRGAVLEVLRGRLQGLLPAAAGGGAGDRGRAAARGRAAGRRRAAAEPHRGGRRPPLTLPGVRDPGGRSP
jgi:AcrR family transcriptional regulator